MDEEEDGEPYGSPLRRIAQVHHQADEDQEPEPQIHQLGEHSSGGQDLPREVHLGDKAGGVDDAVSGGREGGREEDPGQEGHQQEERVGHPLTGNAKDDREDEGEDKHQTQGVHESPGVPQDRLLVLAPEVSHRHMPEKASPLPEVCHGGPKVEDPEAGPQGMPPGDLKLTHKRRANASEHT